MSSFRTQLAFALVFVSASACTVESVDLNGKACPCADGWVCNEATNLCVVGSATGGASGGGGTSGGAGGSGGTTSGGTGGTPSGGSGGTTSGGTGGTTSGGSGGTTSGGTGGTTSGGTGGTTSGGSGGTTSGGSGGTTSGGTGGTGGVSSGSVRCATTKCELSTQVCCHHELGKTDQGTCVAKEGGTCLDIRMFCDDANDCGGSPSVCCAKLDPGGQLTSNVQCQSSASACTATGNGVVEYLCDPATVNPCPAGLTCKTSTQMTGYSSCQQ